MTSAPDMRTIRLLEVPVNLRVRSAEHGNDLVREMTLLQMREDITSPIPSRLVELASQVTTEYAPQMRTADDATDAAVEAGHEVIGELVYEVPATIGPVIERLRTMLAEADEFCRTGEFMLTLETPPAVAEYRAWTLDEFDRQLAGQPPTPWPARKAG